MTNDGQPMVEFCSRHSWIDPIENHVNSIFTGRYVWFLQGSPQKVKNFRAPAFCIRLPLTIWMVPRPGMGVLKKNLGRYVLPRFSEVVSPELIFWLKKKKKKGSREQIFANIYVSGFCQNLWKLGLKMQRFFKK